MFSFDSSKLYLKQELKNLLKEVDQRTDFSSQDEILRLEVGVDSVDLLSWLMQQQNPVRNYWSSRDGSFEAAGIGAAHVSAGYDNSDFRKILPKLKNLLVSSHSNARYYGGLKFQRRGGQEDAWEPFGCCRFVLPQFEIVRDGDDFSLSANILISSKDKNQDAIRNLILELDQIGFDENYFMKGQFARLLSRQDIPDLVVWDKNIRNTLKEFESGTLQKIVLARKSNLKFAGSIDPVSLLNQLKNRSGQSFHFLFQPLKGTAFLGASPECLYKRDNGQIYSEALAGTRPRGTNQFADLNFEKELKTSPKEISEHQWVSNMVNVALYPLCESVEKIDEMSVIKLANVQHLISRFRGKLQKTIQDYMVIEQLHPTPAVGGTPRDLALKRIAELEPFDRGWYAAPVGWIGKDSSEFSVAIRSALVSNGSIALYAGSGIVPGSKPQEEWDEIENKIMNFKKLLQIK